jgi:hypothetical protein
LDRKEVIFIDLMIVTENEDDDYLAGKIWKLTKKVNSKIEPFLIGTNRFNSNDNTPLVDLLAAGVIFGL